MLKKILVLSIFLVVFIVHNSVYAQSPTLSLPVVGTLQIPGDNCGVPDATSDAGKCCYSDPLTVDDVLLQKPGILGVDQAMDVLNYFGKSIFKPIFVPFNNYSQQIIQPCVSGEPTTPGDLGNPSCRCQTPQINPLIKLNVLCDNAGSNDKGKCLGCLGDEGIWTGLGCLYPNTKNFIEKTLLGWGIGLAGGLALLCMIYAAFQMQSSQGNPEKLKKAQETLTSCIMGLMLIITSVFILQLIGVNILRIPFFQ